MKRHILVSSLVMLVSSYVFSGSPIWVLAGSELKPVSVVILQQADYVSVPITITSDQKDFDQRNDELRQSKAMIIDKAKSDPRFLIQDGPTRLATRTNQKFGSFSSSYEPPSQSEMSLLLVLQKDNPNIYICASEVQQLITSVQLPPKAHARTGWVQLVVNNPEQYRPKLTQLIAQNIKTTKDQLATKATVAITGLQHPVSVRRIDEINVEIYIPYEVSITFEN